MLDHTENSFESHQLRYITTELEFSNINFKKILASEKNIVDAEKYNLNKPFYPSDKTLAVLAEITYKNEPDVYSKDELVGWKILTTARNKKDGYFGAVFWNKDLRQLVICHRGTDPKNIGALLTDISGIIRNEYTNQIESATSFAAYILKELEKEKLSVYFTGHSLGGWLAQITNFTTKYLTLMKNKFVSKSKEEKSYHPRTVSFDSPGCLEMLTRLCDDYYPRYKNQNLLVTMDITTYLSNPNLVNCCNRHLGVLYRVFPKLPEWGRKFFTPGLDERFRYSLLSHNIHNIAMSLNNPCEKILDWPLIAWPRGSDKKKLLSGSKFTLLLKKITSLLIDHMLSNVHKNEYIRFFNYASAGNNYNPSEIKQSESGGIILHYKTEIISKNITNYSTFTNDELMFLESWNVVKDSLTEPKILKDYFKEMGCDGGVIEVYNDTDYSLNYSDYTIECKDENSLEKLINYTKHLFSFFPDLLNVMKSQLSKIPRGYEALCNSKTEDYINSKRILQSNVDFNDTLLIEEFLSSTTKPILCLTSISDYSAVEARVYSILSSKYKNVSNNADKHYLFLNWTNLISLNEYFNIFQILTPESVIELLVIDCQEVKLNKTECTKVKDLFTNICKTDSNKKIIILLKEEFSEVFADFDSTKFEHHNVNDLCWSDITGHAQEVLVKRKSIMFQNNEVSLEELTRVNDSQKNMFTELGVMLDSLSLIKIISNQKIYVGEAALNVSHLEAQYIEICEQIEFNNILKHLSDSFIVFVISGFEKLSKNREENCSQEEKFIQFLKFKNSEEENQMRNKIQLFSIKMQIELNSKNVVLAPDDFEKKDFRNLCYNYPRFQIFWIKYKKSTFILQELYNPQLYIPRVIKYRDRIIITINILSELIEKWPYINDLLIFSNTSRQNILDFVERKKHRETLNNMCISSMLQMFDHYEDAKLQFDYLKETKYPANLHWLRVEETEFIWECSHGELTLIQKHIDESKSKMKLINENNFLTKIERSETLLFLDKPGMGKSTSLIKLSKAMSMSHWVIQISLKECTSALEGIEENCITLPNVIEFFGHFKPISVSSLFTKNLLSYKLQHKTSRPLLLLFDGFDEINSINMKMKFASLLTYLKGKAKIWITSREHDTIILQNSLSVFGTQLKAFELSEQTEFLKNFWKSRLILILTKKELIEIFSPESSKDKMNKFECYTKLLLKKSKEILGDERGIITEVPLQLRLMAEGFEQEFRGFIQDDDSTPDFENVNILDIYQRFIHYRFNMYLCKKEDLSSFSVLEKWAKYPLIKRHWRLAFKEIFGDKAKSIIGVKSPFFTCSSTNNLEIDNEELQELFCVGLIHSTHNYNNQFIHRTLAEYLISELIIYLMKKTRKHHKHPKIQNFLITNILLKNEYKSIRIFLNIHLEKEQLSHKTLKLYGQKIIESWSEKYDDYMSEFFNEYHQTFLHILAKENLLNIIKLIFSQVRESSTMDQFKDLVAVRNANQETALYEAVKYDSWDVFNEFLIQVENNCSPHAAEKILFATIFRATDDQINIIIKKIISHCSLLSKNENIKIRKYPKLYDAINKIERNRTIMKTFLEEVSMKTGDVNKIKSIIGNADEEFRSIILSSVDSNHKTALHLATEKENWEIFNVLVDSLSPWDLFEIIISKDMCDKTVVHLLIDKIEMRNKIPENIKNSIHKIFNHLEKNKDIIIGIKNKNDMTILLLAAQCHCWELVDHLINALEAMDDDVKLTLINKTDKNGCGLLHFAAQTAKLKVVKNLVNKGANVLQKGKTTILHEAVLNKDTEVFKLIHKEINWKLNYNVCEIKKYINATDNDGDTPLMWAAGNKYAKLIVQELLNDKATNIKAVNKKGKTAIDIAKERGNNDIHDLIQMKLKFV